MPCLSTAFDVLKVFGTSGLAILSDLPGIEAEGTLGT